MDAKPSKDSPQSSYVPSQEIKEFTATVREDYSHGHDILTKAWNEFNNASVLEDMNRGRQMFNAFVDESFDDPSDSWKWRGTRSMARNKGIAMHANLTAAYLLPQFQAQNADSEEDRGFSEFMTDLVEWMAQDENSDYMPNFLSLVFAIESDPIVYLGAEYQEVMQTVRIKQEDGKYTTKEIMDEVLSGFKAPILTADQVLISNSHERNIQKHRFNITRRWIEYGEAEAKYGQHENFEYVLAGSNCVYNSEDGLFYDIKDGDHPGLVEEVTYKNRRNDTEVCFLAGIYMGASNVDHNPMKHRDNFDAPRYNLQQFGFYPIGSHFIFYKSMMNAMRWDNALYDASTEIVANKAMLEAEPPTAITGADSVDSSLNYPNAVIALKDPLSKATQLFPPSNIAPLIQSLNMTADSMSDASVNDTTAGQLPDASQKAYNVAQAQANAKKIIGGVAKGLAYSVSKYGLLMSHIAIHHLSTPQVDELMGDTTKMKYRKFILRDKEVGGQRMNKQLSFDSNLVGKEMTQQERDYANMDLYKLSQEKKTAIFVANPELFSKMKFLCRSDYREMFPLNDEELRQSLLALKAQLSQDPFTNQEALTKELFYAFFKGRSEKFIQEQQEVDPTQMAQGLNPQQMGSQSMQKAIAPGVRTPKVMA